MFRLPLQLPMAEHASWIIIHDDQLSRVDKLQLSGESLVGLPLEGLVGVGPLVLHVSLVSAKQPEVARCA